MQHTHESLYVPFRRIEYVGGPSTFRKNLKKFLDKRGFCYSNSPRKSRLIFFPVTYPEHTLKKIKKEGGKVIQRLDGVYYPSKHREEYVHLNKDLRNIYLHYADFVIFQSENSRAQCFTMLGEKSREQYEIIVNGVDKTIFYPNPTYMWTPKEEKIRFITTGTFRNKDMLEPIVETLDLLKDKINFELTVVGPIVNPALGMLLNREYVIHREAKKLSDVAQLLRENHVFLFTQQNPCCPNSVLEAISCGIPVVGFDSGAMSELLFFSQDLLAYVSAELFKKYEDYDYARFAEKIVLVTEKYDFYRDRSLQYSHLYSFDECGEKYLNIFQRFLKDLDSESFPRRNILKNCMMKLLKRKGTNGDR
ncbi:MAG: glycosyltransferase [Candidatus Omnitrophica bacterium]|nr:glycosyltransferase [Candidatus Omnitrophota bacterium]